MLSHLRRHLAWKLFLSYLIVILVGATVLASAAEFAVPGAFERHMAGMGSMMGGAGGMGMDLFGSFRAAVSEALALGAGAATLVAVAVSVFVSRQVVSPVQAMMAASQRIARGQFHERVRVPVGASPADLDELAQLAISFNQMAARLEQTETMRRQLIGDVAHELRTPLTAIKGSMEGLLDGVLLAEAETYQQIYREADRLQRLVQDLQELSRVEAGAYELHRRPLDPGALLAAAVARLGRQFAEKGVALETEVPAGLPPAPADEDRIGQVLLNLTGNALQYTPAGGRVRLSVRRQGEALLFSVADTGLGISAEHLPHLFDRFYRVDKSRSRAGGGSGIGLTIARHLVESHGGGIRAESAGPGQGSTFSFTLPLAA
ncbi:MAG: HAMP domain-containing protein [Chloroflexi bacterium]|nr:HAMP domain-containing protein [Chloroflexota bacterium]